MEGKIQPDIEPQKKKTEEKKDFSIFKKQEVFPSNHIPGKKKLEKFDQALKRVNQQKIKDEIEQRRKEIENGDLGE